MPLFWYDCCGCCVKSAHTHTHTLEKNQCQGQGYSPGIKVKSQGGLQGLPAMRMGCALQAIAQAGMR